MHTYFVSKIIYEALVNGEKTKLEELYLHDALTYTEVENMLPNLLKIRIKTFTLDTIDGINKTKFVTVVWHAQKEEDSFYKVKIQVFHPKKKSYLYLVPALDYIEAGQRIKDFLKEEEFKIIDVAETKIMAFWHYNNEVWQGDFNNRMDRYYDEGRFEAGHTDVTEEDDDDKQGEFDFVNDARVKDPYEVVPGAKPASKKKVDKAIRKFKETLDNLAQDGVTVSVQTVEEITEKAMPSANKRFKKGITFLKRNGDPISE